jgi:DNA-binding beta-propeller fold protein YncE
MKKLDWALLGLMIICSLSSATAQTQNRAPLRLIKTFPLSGNVAGRFDHFAADPSHNRLFVVPKDYKTVMVLDLNTGKLIHTIDHLSLPQGVLYRADLDRIYVTDGLLGSVEIFDGKTYDLMKTVKLRLNADSIAYDPLTKYLNVVNGGADAKMTDSIISIVDTTLGETIEEIKVEGDTLEALALEKSNSKMYVDNRAKNQVEEIDRKTHIILASWPVTLGMTMVALALDEANHRLFVGCRDGNIVVFDTLTGKEMQALSIGKGIDDLVFDVASKRIYAACGESGTVDVYEQVDADHYHLLGRIPSGPLARNGLLVRDVQHYFVGVPKNGEMNASILVYQVQ